MWEQIQLLVDPENKACCDSERTRLMKEWCREKGKLLSIMSCEDSYLCYVNFKHTLDLSGVNRGGNIVSYDGLVRCDTEFEAVLKATHWVAKEKGLI